MKSAFRNKTDEKRPKMAIFKLLSNFQLENRHFRPFSYMIFLFRIFFLYAHYPIYFFLLFEQYYQVLCCVKIQEKV